MSFQWEIKGDLAILHEPFKEPIPYNEDSLRLALENVKAERSSYGTEEAWQTQYDIFNAGISLLLANRGFIPSCTAKKRN